MSGAVSAVGKVFKSVTKSAVGKIVIAAAVAYFTAGLGSAVLGATGLSTSLSPVMGTILSNALSGVAAGGITSALTGGNILKGMALGGVGGAVMGGVQTALGNVTPGNWAPQDPSNAAGNIGSGVGPDSAIQTGTDMQMSGPTAQADSVINTNTGLPQGDVPGATLGPYGVVPPSGTLPPVQDMGTVGTAPGTQMAGVPQTQVSSGLLTGAKTAAQPDSGLTKFVKENQTLVGGAVSGVGQGLLSGQAAEAQAEAYNKRTEAQIAADKEKAATVAASHDGGMGLLTPQTNTLNATPRPTPTERFDPRTYGGQWNWDPAQGKLVFTRNG